MKKIARFVLWLCRNFTRQELEEIIQRLQPILSEREPEIPPRDDFQQRHPHYRDFYVRCVASSERAGRAAGCCSPTGLETAFGRLREETRPGSACRPASQGFARARALPLCSMWSSGQLSLSQRRPAGQSIALQDLFGPVSDPASSSNEKSCLLVSLLPWSALSLEGS